MVIESSSCIIEIDDEFGCVRRLYDRGGGVDLITEPRLASNFRLLLPLPHLASNYLDGGTQRLSCVRRSGSEVELRWDGPLVNSAGQFDLGVTIRIELGEDGICFRTTVENRTEYALAEVWHAMLGGINGVGPREQTGSLIATNACTVPNNLFDNFPESMPPGAGGGMRYPEFYATYPTQMSMPWFSAFNRELNRGVYFACQDPEPRLSILRFELHPGLARNRMGCNWPDESEVRAIDEPAGLVMHWVHLPYSRPGVTFEGPEIIVRFHAGDWHEGARLYRRWFDGHFAQRPADEGWLRREQAVYVVMCLLPEDNVQWRFKDFPQLARDAKDFGVTTLLMTGWNVGGHDNQYPRYEPDPRLGTWDDLAEAIRGCQADGVRVLLFVNIHPVDTTTGWYKDELEHYRMMDAMGNTTVWGWGMGTLSARMGYTRRPIVLCDPVFPEFRAMITNQMRRLAELGIDGLHFDKLVTEMDFNPATGHAADRACFVGMLESLRDIQSACTAVRSDFGLSLESHWDRTIRYGQAWWNWHDMLDHTSALKYTFPQYMPTFPVVQQWDYNNVNNAFRFGYQWLIGPVRYSASMKNPTFRPIADYIAELVRLRDQLKDIIFLGEFTDTFGVTVRAHADIRYNTHRDPKTGRHACVLTNLGRRPRTVHVSFTNGWDGPGILYSPFHAPQEVPLPARFRLSGERAAVVVESRSPDGGG